MKDSEWRMNVRFVAHVLQTSGGCPKMMHTCCKLVARVQKNDATLLRAVYKGPTNLMQRLSTYCERVRGSKKYVCLTTRRCFNQLRCAVKLVVTIWREEETTTTMACVVKHKSVFRALFFLFPKLENVISLKKQSSAASSSLEQKQSTEH